MHLDQIETPALIVDLDVMERNIARAASYAGEHGLALRPHVKTHKSPHVARQQLAAGAVGLTCATPFEAEVMSSVCDDILVAFPPVGRARAERLASIPRTTRLTVALDSEQAIDDMNAAATAAGRGASVYIELDLGMHRVGVPVVERAITLAKHVQRKKSLEYAGIAFYPGHVREPEAEQDAKLAQLNRELGDALRQMRSAGVSPRIVSGGSTPTMWRSHEIEGVTEFRPGTYVYNDRTTAAIGACDWDDCALTVLGTVVSNAVPGQAVLDTGTKSLGREPVRGAAGEGQGQLLEHRDVVISRTSEEHGVMDLSKTEWSPQVGERVRVIPNHVCIVVHLNDVIYGMRKKEIEIMWRIEARGRGERMMELSN